MTKDTLKRVLLLICIAQAFWIGTKWQVKRLHSAITLEEVAQEAVADCEKTLPRDQKCIPVIGAVVALREYLI